MRKLLDPRLLLVAATVLVLAAYWAGLSGGFLLDDEENFVQLQRYSQGEVTWLGPIVSNASGPLGRPLSMASFVATVAAGGHAPWPHKVGNLFLHLSIGALMSLLALLCMRRDARFTKRANVLAVLVGALWMALPIHVSTVLYPVQRMAQLSTLFLVMGMLAYIAIRQRLEAAPQSRSWWIALPTSVMLFTALGALSKENGLLLPLLCLVLEITVLSDAPRGRKPAIATLVMLLAVPALLGGVAAIAYHERLFGGYATRDFTLVERLLTQPRVLWEYIWNIAVPAGTRLGVYQDDVAISRSLFSPATTLPAILAWVAVIAAALWFRKQSPLASAGALMFVAGHAMESTVFPLEIYFEHRNYFPAIGALLAVTAIVPIVAARIPPPTAGFMRLLRWAPLALLLVFAASTHGRALVWGSPETLLAQSEQDRPESPRVHAGLAARALAVGDMNAALTHIDQAERWSGSVERGSAALWRILAHCVTDNPVPRDVLAAARDSLQDKPTTFGLRAGILLAEEIEAGECEGLQGEEGFQLYLAWTNKLTIDPATLASWRLRYLSARLAASSNDLPAAFEIGTQAWQDSGWNSGIGVFVVQIANSMGDMKLSRTSVEQLKKTAPKWDLRLQEALVSFEGHLDGQPPDEPSSP